MSNEDLENCEICKGKCSDGTADEKRCCKVNCVLKQRGFTADGKVNSTTILSGFESGFGNETEERKAWTPIIEDSIKTCEKLGKS
jgi:hypothetical protein